VIRILKKNKEAIEKFGVKRIGIFDSVARDEANEKSDIDIVVKFKKGSVSFKNFGQLVEFF